MEAKSREKELRRNKIRDKYAQSMRPVNKQKASFQKGKDVFVTLFVSLG